MLEFCTFTFTSADAFNFCWQLLGKLKFFYSAMHNKTETAYFILHRAIEIKARDCALNRFFEMQSSLRLTLSLSGVAALALANTPLQPLAAQEDGSAVDLGVMSISLKDVVKPTLGFQGALQGAGTPNQAGIGSFLPLSVGDNSVFFADVLLNANFAD